ncbi:hypothetical protein NP233_g11500 [Leucocoprinus birnbaumii]|uniref:Uncharacterized protein n=1 Tax=Leucocoprinus birnbaumii TaxID=56174 RepID=A0AAD5YQW5_9AGAR|nr:hypothetical protein NP233_g11500 [Leucocoprinus birnbaumii]
MFYSCPCRKKDTLTNFPIRLYSVHVDFPYVQLEIDSLIDHGPPLVWPASFGRNLTEEEAYVKLDCSTGASSKLSVLL